MESSTSIYLGTWKTTALDIAMILACYLILISAVIEGVSL